ncbi:MAG: 2OG-Fe dioxygenase family protein [Candidatus Hydrogenedentes bacterium]|nr:2OG-Fe dioxygenase family protein [Candidatus Hydrogenedentota bacterium]
MVTYALTEEDLSQRLGIAIDDPIRLFSFDKSRELIDAIDGTYAELPWDIYDVRHRQIEILLAYHPHQSEELSESCDAFYSGAIGMEPLVPFFDAVPAGARRSFDSILPFRRRAIAEYRVTRDGGSWSVSQQPARSFSMDVQDYRRLPRVFAPMQVTADTCRSFKLLLVDIADMVAETRENVRNLRMTIHQISTVARTDFTATNAPEGIHQDGVDFVVTALVISRNNVIGGVSQLFGPDRKTLWYEHVVQPGEGIFHADAGSPIWHLVTPIAVSDPAMSQEATRNILGFDIALI